MSESRRPVPSLLPYVRHMLVCESVLADRGNPKRVTIQGPLTIIPTRGAPFPFSGGFSVFLQVTEGRRSGSGRIRVVDADRLESCYEGRESRIEFDGDPLKTHLITIRVTRCTFLHPGPYTVEFVFDGTTLAQEPLLVR